MLFSEINFKKEFVLASCMKIFIEKDEKMMEKKFSGKIIVLLKSLDINPTSVLVVKNGSLVTEEDSVNDDDSIKILNVISGG